MADSETILRKARVRERTGLGDTRIWQLEKAGLFPRRVQISDRAVGWLKSEIDEWIAARPRVSGERKCQLKKSSA